MQNLANVLTFKYITTLNQNINNKGLCIAKSFIIYNPDTSNLELAILLGTNSAKCFIILPLLVPVSPDSVNCFTITNSPVLTFKTFRLQTASYFILAENTDTFHLPPCGNASI